MKSPTWMRWLCLGLSLSAVLVTTDAAAKKPPTTPSGDPCAQLSVFTPDFVFWRETGNRKKPQATIFLAESSAGCERKLIDFPLSDFYRIQNLKFSSVGDDDEFFGRVVWSATALFSFEPDTVRQFDAYVWKMDFGIDGLELDPIDSQPVPVLQNAWFDDPTVQENIFWSLDLSPDTRSLVFVHRTYPDSEHYQHDLLILPDIDTCADASNPCGFDTGWMLDTTGVVPNSSAGPSFTFASWGPEGDSVYVMKRLPNEDPEFPLNSYTEIDYYYDLNSLDIQTGSIRSYPNIIARPLAGKIGETTYLAVEKEFSEKTGGCEGIFITNLEECLASGQDCFTTPTFAGKYPSWTKDGKLIHAYDGWEPHGGCGLSAVGIWDPEDGSLRSILDGLEPDAAGR